MYSNELDSVFCFCCKLFNSKSCTNQLANQGTKIGEILVVKLKDMIQVVSILLI